jgi:magnesium transporter
MMIISSYQLNDGLELTPLAPEDAADACQNKAATVWLDLQGFESAELEAWLSRLKVTSLARRLCLEAQNRTGFYPLRDELLLVVPVLTDKEGPREADYLVCLCTENLLLTYHGKPVLNPKELAALEESHAWLPQRSISGLVSALMIDRSLECLRHATDLRNSILALEERMDREPDAVEAEDILDMRSELVTVSGVVSDELPALQALSVTDKPFFKLEDAQEYMNCAVANLQAADGSLARLSHRVDALRSGFQMHAQDKTNRRLGMLTILSAIFMPITLLAGIWGMNFETMPELKYSFSYPIALGFMALIGAGMYMFFRKGGWLD